MIAAPLPANESERLEALKRYQILDTESEKELEDIVHLASTICQTPMSLVSLVDENRQWFKARLGIVDSETARDVSFCAHVLLENDVMVVENALEDERFNDNPLVTADPNVRFYAGAPLVTHDGFKLGTLCILDNKPRKLTEQQQFALKTLSKQVIKHFELRLQNIKLQELTSLQNRFLSILSHDMKNPLIGIDGLLTLMNNDEISKSDFHELADEISGQVKLVLNLLNDLMGWANSSGNSELNKTSFALKPMVQETLDLLAPMALHKNLTLHNFINPELITSADEAMLKFIIRNLLTNAIKFTATGSIEVQGENLGDFQKISVKDSGIGMSEDQIAKLFNVQKRYTTIGTGKEKGSGLGLLLCNEFVKKHGGVLSIESKPGQGSVFSFTVAR